MGEREKSALYPNASWQDCIDFVKKIDSFKLKAVAYQEVANLYGLSSTTTRSFTSKISSSKQFGLITTSENTIQLTDTCKRYLYPTGNDTRSIELACFQMPPLYNKLIAVYDGKALPEETVLGNILMTEYKITRSAKDSAAKLFVESANQLSLIKGGVLTYSEAESTPKEEVHELPTVIATAPDPVAAFESDYITQTIPMKSGKVAKIIIPIDSEEDDLYLLRDMLEIILRRKFKIKTDLQ